MSCDESSVTEWNYSHGVTCPFTRLEPNRTFVGSAEAESWGEVLDNATLIQLEQIIIQQWQAITMHRIHRLIHLMMTEVRECIGAMEHTLTTDSVMGTL